MASGWRRVRRWTLWLLLALLAIVLAILLWWAGWIVWWKYQPVDTTSFMRRDIAALQAKTPTIKLVHEWVSYDKISVHLKRAVIAAEDANFLDHEGVDWEAIEVARAKNKKKGKVVAGGSTITMQLAKNLFLSGERSYVRKGQELVITYMLETILDKRRILELYLNSVEFGIGVYGAQAAAKHYYGNSAAQLSPAQAARLAAMLPRPKFYDRNQGSAYLAKRVEAISRYMNETEEP
jgi:monofunctional biosynthetic peptidoglycan transglycosylase